MSDLTADQVMSNLRPSTQNKLLDRITELEAENARLKGVLREAVGVMKLWRKGDPLPIHVTDGWIDRIAKEWPDGL